MAHQDLRIDGRIVISTDGRMSVHVTINGEVIAGHPAIMVDSERHAEAVAEVSTLGLRSAILRAWRARLDER